MSKDKGRKEIKKPKQRRSIMTVYKKKPDFLTSDEGIKAAEALQLMVLDDMYITKPTFSADTETYADNLIPFIDKHMAYLRSHPAMNPRHYLSNLRLMTRVGR